MNIKTAFFWNPINIFFVLCLGGCQTDQTPPAPRPIAVAPASPHPKDYPLFAMHAAPMEEHVWEYLNKAQAVDEGYGLYTYVLTGRNISDLNAKARYSELVGLIQASTTAKSDISSDIDKSRLNIFLIPAKGPAGEERADQELAMALLLKITLGSGKEFSGPGPYLFSLHQPIRSVKSNSLVDLLYVDLSNIHEKAFRELVSAYKERVTESAVSGIEKLKSFRISLLNAALITEDSIGFIKTAEASFHDTFSP